MGTGREFLGGYRLIRLIRAGQTCQIWEAASDDDRRRVALKVLQPELRSDKVEVGYLKHEFEVGKDLKHDDVIKIFEFNSDRGVAYLVMEYNAGKNIKLVVRQGLEYLHYMAQEVIEHAALGLGYLHEQGWVHRDIKPDNFLVTEWGQVKLIDFALAHRRRTGLAKLFAGRAKVQGTRSYMSPEQIRGRAVDERSDIYSFGCMLYEMLSGRPPYTGINPEDLLMKHLRAPVPTLLVASRNVTPDFANVVMQMMAKEPEKRLESMSEFLRHFRALRVFRAQPKVPEGVNASPPAEESPVEDVPPAEEE